jgi:phosphoribosylanthranilate isomerase
LVRVKFCGFTAAKDVEAACRLHPDLLGVIVGIPESPRNVNVDKAAELLRRVPRTIQHVCVTRTRKLKEALELVEALHPDYLQVHPDLPPEEMRKLKAHAGLILVFSIPPKHASAEDIVNSVGLYEEIADIVLLDTKGPTGGGTGTPHDWRISGEIRKSLRKPVFLAGGLNPENVREAIEIVKPDGVDVSTGIEVAPGRKSVEKMKRFLEAVAHV